MLLRLIDYLGGQVGIGMIRSNGIREKLLTKSDFLNWLICKIIATFVADKHIRKL